MPYLPPGGVSPASAFDVEGVAEQPKPPAILAPWINPTTGEIESLVRSRPVADSMAIEAIRIERGSGASVRDLGHRYREIRNVEDGIAELVESTSREAFAAGEASGAVRLERVTATVDDGDSAQVNVVLEYRDRLAPSSKPLGRLAFTL